LPSALLVKGDTSAGPDRCGEYQGCRTASVQFDRRRRRVDKMVMVD
jgi:hypothetical protein